MLCRQAYQFESGPGHQPPKDRLANRLVTAHGKAGCPAAAGTGKVSANNVPEPFPLPNQPASQPLAAVPTRIKPKLATRPTVIYLFSWVAGSGGVYVGKHTPSAAHDANNWPRAGVGRLPNRYGGSGQVISNARHTHGDEAFSWKVLEVVPVGGDYTSAEVRWVAWAKEQYPERCRNLTNGGEGIDSETARRCSLHLWKVPAVRAVRHKGTLKTRLAPAMCRRDGGERPLPLDNLCLDSFGERRNPLPCIAPKEPRRAALLDILEALRRQPEGLTVPELCELTGRPERGAGGGVRKLLDDLRLQYSQPILNVGGTFCLLAPGEY